MKLLRGLILLMCVCMYCMYVCVRVCERVCLLARKAKGENGEGEWERCEWPIYESAIKLSVMMDVPPFLH